MEAREKVYSLMEFIQKNPELDFETAYEGWINKNNSNKNYVE